MLPCDSYFDLCLSLCKIGKVNHLCAFIKRATHETLLHKNLGYICHELNDLGLKEPLVELKKKKVNYIYHRHVKVPMKSNHYEDYIYVDELLADTIDLLWAVGIKVYSGCQGDDKKGGYLMFINRAEFKRFLFYSPMLFELQFDFGMCIKKTQQSPGLIITFEDVITNEILNETILKAKKGLNRNDIYPHDIENAFHGILFQHNLLDKIRDIIYQSFYYYL